MKSKITLLGNGSWSSALAKILTDNGHSICWWMRSFEARVKIQETGHNPHYLTSVQYNLNQIVLTQDIEEAISNSDIIIIGVPSAFIVDVLKPLSKNIFQHKKIVSAIKGILPNENLLLNEYLEKEFNFSLQNYACITGPCHAEEVASEKLSYLTFASIENQFAEKLSSLFQNRYIKTISSQDIFGVQYAAVLKNIYALGAGIAHGLDYGDNFLSVFITNCFSELQQFMNVISTHSLHHYNTSAYLGDLLVTCYSLHSRNRTFGNFIGKGYSVNAAKLELNMIAEGYFASKGIYEICKKMNHNLEIANSIYSILWENHSAQKVFSKIENICS